MSPEVLLEESKAALQKARLLYVTDAEPGIARRRCGKGFVYLSPQGTHLRNSRELKRIKSLAVPPAWREVWICPKVNGHLQATGKDDKERKQYLYHPKWCELRRELQFQRVLDFGEALPRLRRKASRILGRKTKLDRELVLACAIRILDEGHLRVGQSYYRDRNKSYGLSTLLKKHVRVSKAQIHFSFRGKKGVWREVDIQDQKVARVISECKKLPGPHLFSYYDERGQVSDLSSVDINQALSQFTGESWTAKDFRTWWGSVCAYDHLSRQEPDPSMTARKRQLVAVVKEVAATLGNTPAICRKHYVHPELIRLFETGQFACPKRVKPIQGLHKKESEFLAFLSK